MTSTRVGHVVGGRYRLVAELGSGGFGRVWRARDETLDVDVAIKELRLLPGMSPAEQAERLARATREARNAARLRMHKNIVAIHDIVVEDGLPWIVMDLIDGRSLDEHLRTHGPLPVDRVATIAVALLAAIGAAHREGVVHRDIKPANVMLAEDGRVLLTDFGTAVHDTDTALTATGMVVGSPEYTAPERLRGTDGLPASDLFSLGATLFQAVEGVSPFHRGSPTATLSAVLLDPAPVPRRAGPLTRVITGLLDKNLATRPTVPEALAMAGVPADASTTPVQLPVRQHTKVITTRDGRGRPVGWRRAVEVLLAFAAVLGVVAFTGGSVTIVLESFGYGVILGVVVDGVLVGVLCAGVARLVPASAGRTVSVVVGAAGFLIGGGAASFLIGEILANVTVRAMLGEAGEDDVWTSLIVITVVLLAAVGWTRLSPTTRRPNRDAT
ncbi:serine/threonine-protein kinase [Actinophytocola sp.]|uniref:serine/threonine-protein kinase n=1 Tax=Actinophytocola sp. TaxID=1872138 RepID=UPI002ED63526